MSSRSRIARFIVSARLAAWLIGVQILFLVVSFMVPQRGIFPDDQVAAFYADTPALLGWLVGWLKLDHVFTSFAFYVSAVLLAVNLTWCTVDRMRRRAKARGVPAVGVVPDRASMHVVLDGTEVDALLRGMGASRTILSDTDTRYHLRRGELGFAGSVVMHAALIAVLIGGVISGLTNFRAEMLFTEGQTHADTPDDYLSISRMPRWGNAFADANITLERMEFTYEDGAVVDAVARFRVDDARGLWTDEARVNYPLKVQGKSFLLQDAGHSVWLTINGPGGERVLDSFVNLQGVTALGYRDALVLPEGELAIVSRPDKTVPLEAPLNEGLELVAPIVGLSFESTQSPDDFTWISPGSPATQLGEYTIAVNEVRVWNRFMVRVDDGRYVMYVCFLLIISGSIVRFLFPDRWLRAAVIEDDAGVRLYMWGAERYTLENLPREGRRLVKQLGEIGSIVAPAPTGGDDS